MYKYYAIYKPFGMISGFTGEKGKQTLGDLFIVEKDVYPVGRLDADSEGLLLLTNDRRITNQLLNPDYSHHRTYLVQVDREINDEACRLMEKGVNIALDGNKYLTKQCSVEKIAVPDDLPERVPTIRYRKSVPTSWIKVILTEGKNRQVRKMTAAAGFPTLRLIRVAIESIELGKMKPGDMKEFTREEFYRLLKLRK